MLDLLLKVMSSGMVTEINGKKYLLLGCPAGEAVGVFHKDETGFFWHLTNIPVEKNFEYSDKDEELVRQVVTRLETEAQRKAA